MEVKLQIDFNGDHSVGAAQDIFIEVGNLLCGMGLEPCSSSHSSCGCRSEFTYTGKNPYLNCKDDSDEIEFDFGENDEKKPCRNCPFGYAAKSEDALLNTVFCGCWGE
jgi:hypothetical protein